ncbi:MAG: radical SAM protein [Thermosphaera sp.]
MNRDMGFLQEIGKFGSKPVYYLPPGLPGLGHIAFGVIDRGTNVIQVRPTTICPMNCAFCSVDAGLYSSYRGAEFIADPEVILNSLNEVASVKTAPIEVLIDTVGEGLTYPFIYDLVKSLKNHPKVKSVALETHGAPLSEKTINKLWDSGLDRVNLSFDTFSIEKARILYGLQSYNPLRVAKLAEYITKETSIDLHVTPLWLPKWNDEEIEKILEWALKIGAGKKWPPVTVQKFNEHKYGRNRLRIKPVSWAQFFNWLESLERRTGIRVKWTMKEWGMVYDNKIPIVYKKGDIVGAETIAKGWLKRELLGITLGRHKRLITMIPGKNVNIKVGARYAVKIIEDKDGIYVGKIIEKI